LGANNVIIRSVKPSESGSEDTGAASQQNQRSILAYGLKYQDFERLMATLPTVMDAVPVALVTKHARRNTAGFPTQGSWRPRLISSRSRAWP